MRGKESRSAAGNGFEIRSKASASLMFCIIPLRGRQKERENRGEESEPDGGMERRDGGGQRPNGRMRANAGLLFGLREK